MSRKLTLRKETLQPLGDSRTSGIIGGAPLNTGRFCVSQPPVCDSEFCTVQMGSHCFPCQLDPSIIDPVCKPY